MELLVIVLVVVAVLWFAGGYGGRFYRYGSPTGIVGLVLAILVVAIVLRLLGLI